MMITHKWSEVIMISICHDISWSDVSALILIDSMMTMKCDTSGHAALVLNANNDNAGFDFGLSPVALAFYIPHVFNISHTIHYL